MEAIIVALISLIGVVFAALLQSFRKENRNDHAIVADSLNRIETKIDTHIVSHGQGAGSAS